MKSDLIGLRCFFLKRKILKTFLIPLNVHAIKNVQFKLYEVPQFNFIRTYCHSCVEFSFHAIVPHLKSPLNVHFILRKTYRANFMYIKNALKIVQQNRPTHFG